MNEYIFHCIFLLQFFHLCRQVIPYLLYKFTSFFLSFCHLFIDKLLCVFIYMYIFKHVPYYKIEREAEPLNSVLSFVVMLKEWAWTSMLNSEKRNEWWQSETFTITVDYKCRLKFLVMLNIVSMAKEHFYIKTTMASGLISAMLNLCTACNKMFIPKWCWIFRSEILF